MTPPDKDRWHGIPREQINWHPTVVTDRCVGDGMCVTSCGRQVFAFDFEANVPVVVAPDRCMVGCTTCATLCLEDAIEFPSRGYVRQLIRSRKLLRQAKDALNANPARYQAPGQREPKTGRPPHERQADPAGHLGLPRPPLLG